MNENNLKYVYLFVAAIYKFRFTCAYKNLSESEIFVFFLLILMRKNFRLSQYNFLE